MPNTSPGDSDAIEDYWEARVKTHGASAAAVDPSGSNSATEIWKREAMQSETIKRAFATGRRGLTVDMGCGFGDWSLAFAPHTDRIIACDITPAFVNLARKSLTEAGVANNVSVSPVQDFVDFTNADFVYLGAVMTYVDDAGITQLLKNVRARINDSAIVMSRDWCAVNLGRSTVVRKPGKVSYHRRPEEYARHFANNGFRVEEVITSAQMYRAHAGGGLTPWVKWRLLAPLARRRSVSFVVYPA